MYLKIILKPQDIGVVNKALRIRSEYPPYGAIAIELKMSVSETHSAVQRLKNSRLLHGSKLNEKPNLSALEESLIHDVKYSFPVEPAE